MGTPQLDCPDHPGQKAFLQNKSKNLPAHHPGCSSTLTVLLVVKKRLCGVPLGPKVIVPLLAKRGGSSELELQAVEKVGGNEELGVGEGGSY